MFVGVVVGVSLFVPPLSGSAGSGEEEALVNSNPAEEEGDGRSDKNPLSLLSLF